LLALAACGQRDDQASSAARNAGDTSAAEQRSSSAAAEARQETREATADAAATLRNAETAVMGAAGEAKHAAAEAATGLGHKLQDAEIVTKIKTGLAADKDLSALSIDVDSKDGEVTLSGTAPSSAAKARADAIAKNVKDVRKVHNRLEVKAG
jgi:osmotically-inducible protein OsmY